MRKFLPLSIGERSTCGGAVVRDEDVSRLDVAMEDDLSLVAIGPNLVLEKCKRLAHLQEESPDVAFWHWLVIPGFELGLPPFLKVAKMVVLKEGGTMLCIGVRGRIVDRRRYPIAIWNQLNGHDFQRQWAMVRIGRHFEHLLYDFTRAIIFVLQYRHVGLEYGLDLPLARVPNKRLAGGGPFRAFTTAIGARSSCTGFAFSHICVWR
jgi:hypothetical protein